MRKITKAALFMPVLLLVLASTADCTVREDVKAGFSASPLTGQAPLEVNFTDESTGNPTSWSWNFGDAETSTEQDPVHTYAAVGDYRTSLLVSNATSTDSLAIEGYIKVTDTTTLPSASFTASDTTGPAPLVVNFTDQSLGNPTSWSWSFGDGDSSSVQNPQHTYQTEGTYDVALIISNANGADTLAKPGYIKVAAAYKEITSQGITLKWMVDGANLKVIVSAPTLGWVSAGFNPSQDNHKDANIIIGYVKSGTVYIQDNFGTAAFVHASDVSLGGTDNVTDATGTESSGVTEIGFTIPLDSGDPYDRALTPGQSYKVILAYGPNGADNFTSQHLGATIVTIQI
jgi:PKD repeat protein